MIALRKIQKAQPQGNKSNQDRNKSLAGSTVFDCLTFKFFIMETKVKSTKGTNGKGTKADVKSVTTSKEVNGTTAEIIKPEDRREKINGKQQEKPEQKAPVTDPVLSLDEKIALVENLKVTIEKREKLIDARKKLNSFVIGSHQFSENIVLTDGQGNTFKTSNTEVFGSVVEVIRQTLDDKIKDLEKEIKF